MKILVFDDTSKHRQAAIILLGKDHDLTVVGTYDEAAAALSMDVDYGVFQRLEVEVGHGRYPHEGTADQKAAWDRTNDELIEKARRRPGFDVVLTDLLVPASRKAQGGEGLAFVGQEMPLGTVIALRALAAGVKKVAVVTDMNHHHHPASAAFDGFAPFSIGDVKVICTNEVGMIAIDEATGEQVDGDFLETAEGKAKYLFPSGENWGPRKGLVWGKDWKGVLDLLTAAAKAEEL